jgi:drug/metabolite transporter (DMT)-like permease
MKFLQNERFVNTALAWTFVVIWGSGFVATKVALQYTSPLVFLTIRFGLGVLCLGVFALFARLNWPRSPMQWLHIVVAGLLVNAAYLGSSHYAQYLGMSAGTAALILASQPLLTACIASLWMNEQLLLRQWAGVAIGLIGVLLVVWHKLDAHAVSSASLIAVLFSLTSIVIGTLYQRRFNAQVDLRAASLIQFVACLVVLYPLALAFEGWHVRWSWQLLAAAAFLVIGASILALNAFHILMRRGQASKVTGLMYLTPVVAVLLELAMFGLVPSAVSVLGIVIVCAGVALMGAVRRSAAAPISATLAQTATPAIAVSPAPEHLAAPMR